MGGCFNFLTLVYIGNALLILLYHLVFSFSCITEPYLAATALVLLFTVPLAYDKYEDKVDPLGEKAMIELKKQYAVLDEKVLSKIPLGPLKNKKKD